MNKLLLSVGLLGLSMTVKAQLSSNPDKFLGNITTRYQVDYGKEKFYTLWNQITCENESKWASTEGGSRGSFSFGGSDNAANYAKQHKFPFKFHTLIWGDQYPGWMDKLSTAEQYKAIVEYFDALKKHYPNLEIIDVVNEAIAGHHPAPYKAALGGDGRTGYDWIIKAFELAHERWPNAILVYNDFNTFQWQINEFITLCQTLRNAGAPIDAYGCQSHDVTDMDVNTFKQAINKLQNALKMPMYSTEYDIGTDDDAKQLKRYKEQIPYMWEADYCAGITLWGYIYGATWTDHGNSGIIKDGKDRPAMTWLRDYMKSDAAKTAKSPFPGFKKEASVYVRPASLKVAKGDKVDIHVRASLRTKTIEKVELYVANKLDTTMTEAPYIAEYEATTAGTKQLKAIVYDTEGNKYERLGSLTVLSSTKKRAPFKGEMASVPGTIEAENFDEGADGVAFHDSDATNSGVKTYRTDGAGVDIISIGEGYGIGNTKDSEWLEYTVDVKEAGLYSLDIEVASTSGGLLHVVENTYGDMRYLTDFVEVPKTGSLNEYKLLHVRLAQPLEVGRQVISLCIDKGGFNIDRMTFTPYEDDKSLTVSVSSVKPTSIGVGDKTTISVTAKSSASTIASVQFYANNLLIGTVAEAPYVFEFEPTEKGTYSITAIAVDADGKEKMSAAKTLKVSGKRVPYKTVIDIPGVIQAENFDKGGEGLTFHDSDGNDEGDAKYRTDNEGLDLVKGNGGSAIGYTAKGEWTEYSVNVTEAGDYACEATVSSGTTGSGFTVGLVKNNKVTNLFKINVPQTGNNNWDTYKVVKVDKVTLNAGEQILRITIDGINCNIDKLEFKSLNPSGIMAVGVDNQKRTGIYTLQGVMVGTKDEWETLPSGVYIVDGNKRIKK